MHQSRCRTTTCLKHADASAEDLGATYPAHHWPCGCSAAVTFHHVAYPESAWSPSLPRQCFRQLQRTSLIQLFCLLCCCEPPFGSWILRVQSRPRASFRFYRSNFEPSIAFLCLQPISNRFAVQCSQSSTQDDCLSRRSLYHR